MKGDDNFFEDEVAAGHGDFARLLLADETDKGVAVSRGHLRKRSGRGGRQAPRRETNAAATSLPFARPLEARMTWPKRNWATLSSPPR